MVARLFLPQYTLLDTTVRGMVQGLDFSLDSSVTPDTKAVYPTGSKTYYQDG